MQSRNSKAEADSIVSPRSLAPSSSASPAVVPPIVGIPHKSESPQPPISPISSAAELSDDEYYRHLYRSAQEDWGSESAEALVTLAKRVRAHPNLDHSEAWCALDRACKNYVAQQEQEAYFAALREKCRQKKQELAELQASLETHRKERKQRAKRKRTLSLSPRAFVQSLGLRSPRSRSGSLHRPATERDRAARAVPRLARVHRSQSSGVLPRLPRASKRSHAKDDGHC